MLCLFSAWGITSLLCAELYSGRLSSLLASQTLSSGRRSKSNSRGGGGKEEGGLFLSQRKRPSRRKKMHAHTLSPPRGPPPPPPPPPPPTSAAPKVFGDTVKRGGGETALFQPGFCVQKALKKYRCVRIGGKNNGI